jgi:PAS domain S-box-containing protein
MAADASFRAALHARRDEIAAAWHDAIAPTGFSPLSGREVRDHLLLLTDRAIDALLAEPFDPAAAEAIGAALVGLRYVHPDALRRTHDVLARQFGAGRSAAQVAAAQPRLVALLGGVAAGFARALRAVTHAEQEEMRAALRLERRRAEEALRASEARFRAVFATAGIGIGLADLEGRIVASNPAWQAMLGYSEAELRGLPFTDLAHPDDARASWGHYQELVAGRLDHYEMEARLYRKGGEEVWIHLVSTLVRDAAGRPEFSIGMGENISERKRAEEAREAHARAAEAARGETAAILDATVEAIMLVAPDGTVRSANRRCAELFPLGAVPLAGRPFAEVRAELARVFDDPSAVDTLGEAVADAEGRFTRDLAQRRPERRALELFSAPVRDAAGAWLGRLFAFRDVTREREVERMKDEFLAMVSHDLRSPLTAIKGYVDLLLAGDVGELLPEQREFLAIVQHNTDRLAGLVTDLLDLARMEAAQIALRHTAMDIARVIREVAASFRPQVAGKRQRLVVRAPRGLPAVWGDTERVTQILTNLISNAHKYTPEGGRITVVAAAAREGIRLEVRDTGIGLSPEDQARLFTRFFRAKNRATQEAGGTGLGLAITRALVEAHGGRIAVQSSPGQGSTFRLTLPTAPDGALPPA